MKCYRHCLSDSGNDVLEAKQNLCRGWDGDILWRERRNVKPLGLKVQCFVLAGQGFQPRCPPSFADRHPHLPMPSRAFADSESFLYSTV